MTLSNYKPTAQNFWTGRIDDPTNRDAFRMHQIINLIDLENISKIEKLSTKLNICFLGFCCDEGIKRNLGRPGAKKGPEYIRKEFANLPVTFNEQTLLYDAGDIHCVGHNLEEAQNQLAIASGLILNNGFFPIILGGGHEISFGHYLGIKNHMTNKKLGIINFDAHLDIRPLQEKGSSGTMFSQIAQVCEQENLDFSYLCFGVQTYANTINLFKRADAFGAKYILEKDINTINDPNILAPIHKFIEENDHIYLTLDCDVFGSAHAPGVSAMQPFGMEPEIVLSYLKEIIKSKKVISFDVAEVSPRFDQDNHTAKLVAVIIYSIINTLIDVKFN